VNAIRDTMNTMRYDMSEVSNMQCKVMLKAEHEYMKPVSTCALICGKPVGIVTHRSKYLSDTL
jgi:hypothetical protein